MLEIPYVMAFFDGVGMFSVVSFGKVKDWSALILEDKKNWEEKFSPSNMGQWLKACILTSSRPSQERKDRMYLHITLSTQSITE